MNWTHCTFLHQECWISGIYKVCSYTEGQYQAFFIQDHFKNWGDHVAPPPDRGDNNHPCWRSLESAQKACADHAAKHNPAPKTIRRAAELLSKATPIPGNTSTNLKEEI